MVDELQQQWDAFVAAGGLQRYEPPRSKAEKCGKLSAKDVKDIRRALELGASSGQLQKKYGVNKATIWRVKAGLTWKGV